MPPLPEVDAAPFDSMVAPLITTSFLASTIVVPPIKVPFVRVALPLNVTFPSVDLMVITPPLSLLPALPFA